MRHLVIVRCPECGSFFALEYKKLPPLIRDFGYTWRDVQRLASDLFICSRCAERYRKQKARQKNL